MSESSASVRAPCSHRIHGMGAGAQVQPQALGLPTCLRCSAERPLESTASRPAGAMRRTHLPSASGGGATPDGVLDICVRDGRGLGR